MIDFDEYIRQGEPGKRERADAWRVAIGLQAVDGLKTSTYLGEAARRNIEGEISIDEARELIRQYYVAKTERAEDDDEKEEADRVSGNISKYLQGNAFSFSLGGFVAVHKAIFSGVFKHAGRFRNYDISKREWVLRGDSVLYGRWQDLDLAIEYDLDQERRFKYAGLDSVQVAERIARFVSGLWQIHPFAEGNTRATAVFTIKYLRTLGFDVNNDMFEHHSWYFRNALVRANYHNLSKGIDYEPVFLIRFFQNLLFGVNNELKNRYMLINLSEESDKPSKQNSTPTSSPTSTPTSQVHTDNNNIIRLVAAIGQEQYSVKELMSLIGLRDRENFLQYSLNPAIKDGFVRLLYPDSPRHPRQKYLLTVKGLLLLKSLN